MAHSGNSITFAMDVLPNENNIYSLGSSDKKWKIFGDVTGNADTATSLTNFVVSTYTIAAGKGVRIQYPSQAPVLISCQRSNSGGRLILIGGGYGAEGSIRNDFTEVVSPNESSFTWSMPAVTGYARTIEIMNNPSSGTATVWVESTEACTFTEITALTSTKTNRNLLHSINTSAGTNNNATLAWNTAYTIAKINGTDIKFTTMAKPTYTYSDVGAAPSSTVSCTTENVKTALGTGSGTTKFLREDGSWQTPAYIANTDEKLKIATVTSGTTYYPIVAANSTAAANRQYDATGFAYLGTNGTTSAVGVAKITLGNSTASGTANNKQGSIGLYGSTAYLTTIISGAPTAANTLTLPTATGTIALTSDITHHTAYLYAGANNATAHAAVSSGTNIYLCLRENNTQRSAVQIKQGSNMTISSDANGIITFASSYTNTDTLVKQTAKTDNVKYKLLASAQASPTSGTAYEAVYDAKVYINPSLNTINAGGLVVHDKAATPAEKVTMQWNATDSALEFVFA